MSSPPRDNWGLRLGRFVLMAWVFLLVLALDPFTADPAGPIKLLISGIAAVLLSVLGVVAFRRDVDLRLSSIAIVPVVFVFWHSFRMFTMVDRNPLPSDWYLYLIIGFCASQFLRSADDVWRLAKCIVIAVALSSVYGFIQAAGWDPFPWSARDIEEYRGLPATYANPNFAGHALVIALPLALGLLWRMRGAQRLLWLVAFALMLTHLYLTHMRGGPVALIGAGLFLALVYAWIRRGVTPERAGARLLLVGIAATLVVGATGIFLAARTPDTPLPLDSSVALRLNGYHGAAQMALDHPVFGVGSGNYPAEAPRYWSDYEARWFANTGKMNQHVHNDLLETAAETGLPGAALYIAMMLAGILGSLRLMRDDQSGIGWVLAAGFVAFAIDGLFGFNLRVPVSAGLYALLWGMLLARYNARSIRGGSAVVLLIVSSLVAGLFCYFAVVRYLGERDFQWSDGGRVYLGEQLAADTPADRLGTEFDAIETRLERATGRLPDDPRPERLHAQVLGLRGDWAAAADVLGGALEKTPHDPALRTRKAHAAYRATLPDDGNTTAATAQRDALNVAYADAEAALKIAPTYSEAHRVAGLTQARLAVLDSESEAHRDKAIDHLENALQYGVAARGEVQRVLARLYAARGDSATAARYFRQSAESTPEDIRVWDAWAAFADQETAHAPLADALHRALAAPDLPLGNRLELARRLAALYTGPLAQPDLAVPVLASALKDAPYRIDLWATAIHDDDPQAALRALAAQLGPRTDDWPEAVTYLLDAPTVEDGEGLLRLGQLYAAVDAWSRADAALDRALQRLPADRRAPALRLRSDALAALGQPAAALALAKEAVQRDPNNIMTTLAYARRLAEAGKYATADFQYEALRAQVHPDTPMYRDLVTEHAAVRAALSASD